MKVELKNISKIYNRKTLLENINLLIDTGSVYCLLGKNGAGKSTLLEMVLTLTKPDSGSIAINDQQVLPVNNEQKKKTGAALNNNHLLETLTAEEYLLLLGHIYGLEKDRAKERMGLLLNYYFKKEELHNKQIRHFSSGMKKKTILCAAFLHNPDLILLDEPFTFLDPAACANLCDMITALSHAGKTIIVSSHDLLYIDRIATHIGILDDKQFVFNNSYEAFKKQDDFFKENKLLKQVLDYNNSSLGALMTSLN